MPKAVILDDIVRALYESEWKSERADTVTLGYDKFKDFILGEEIYTANPSIENAWTRLTHSVYCDTSTRGVRGHPESKKALISLETIRIRLYGAPINLNITKTNTYTKTKTGVKE